MPDDNGLSPTNKWHKDSNFCLIFKGSSLKQRNATFTSPKRIDLTNFNRINAIFMKKIHGHEI